LHRVHPREEARTIASVPEKKPAWRGLFKCIVLLRHCGDESSRKLLFLHLAGVVSLRQQTLRER
jgi:hypothetical protein